MWRAQERTQWAEMPHEASPRFGVSRTVIIEALPEDLPEDESYKMCGIASPSRTPRRPCPALLTVPRAHPGRSFALLGQQYVTQWIALSDGGGRYVDHLTLTLTASGSTVTAARWEEVFRSGGAPPHSIPLSVHWKHSMEEDAESALDLLLGTAALALFFLLCRTLQKSQGDDLARAAHAISSDTVGDEPSRSWQVTSGRLNEGMVNSRKYM